MAHTNIMIIEVGECAKVVEIEGFIWYHVVSPFSPGWEKTKVGSTPTGVCCLFAVDDG